MYQAVQRGWVPPDHVTREQYWAARDLPDPDPMKAFCGFGCSFGGKWFGGWVRPIPGKADHRYTKRGLLRDVPKVRRFEVVDFLAERPRPLPLAIYCDPPYRGTTEYSTGAFDSDRFWALAEDWSRYTDVFVSEYSAPIGQLIWEKTIPIQLDRCGQRANQNSEKLFKL